MASQQQVDDLYAALAEKETELAEATTWRDEAIANKDAEIERLNLAHAHATAAAARRVRELEEALAAMVREFESGWPSHATESIGGLGHMPGESCNACRMMRPYKDAQSALAGKERSDGAE